jgi:hypothetical protein
MFPVVREVFARRRGVRAADAADLKHQLAVGAVERILAAQVDLSAGRVGVQAGGERVVELDRLDAGDRHLLEGVLAADVVVGSGGGHAGTVERERGVLRVEATDAHRRGIHLRVVERDTGHRLHEFAYVAHGERTVVVGGDDVLGIHRGATFHDGAGLAFALRRDDHHVQLVCIAVSGV